MKKKILTLVLSIMLALSVATGATFALFSTETEVNIAINSGKVKLYATADNFTTASAKWDDSIQDYVDEPNAGLIFATLGHVDVAAGKQSIDIINMVPGDSVNFQITIENTSNVAVLYKIDITANDEDAKLFDVLEITIGNDTFTGSAISSIWTTWLPTDPTKQVIDVSIKLPVEVGNDYQDESLSIKYFVYGVQANAHV